MRGLCFAANVGIVGIPHYMACPLPDTAARLYGGSILHNLFILSFGRLRACAERWRAGRC